MTKNEFDIIKHFFINKVIQRDDVILGSGDDCAIVETPPNIQLAITTDTLVAGVHFPNETSAYHIGYKTLAVNLSDLAAMGATPAWVTVALTIPNADENWLEEFSHGFFALANRFNVQLIGGDLTHGPLTITAQAIGFVPKNKALTRYQAKAGDLIYVTNTLGDAALALKNLQTHSINRENVLNKLNQPEPQIEIGKKLLDIANAAIDISDGLASDLTHILKASKTGAVIFVDNLPISTTLKEALPIEEAIELALTGGDDYELCFTVPKEKLALLKNIPHITQIGFITSSSELDLQYQDGRKYNGSTQGYRHF